MNVSIDTLRRFEIEANATIYIGWGLRTISLTISEFDNSRESLDEATTLEIYSKNGFCKFVDHIIEECETMCHNLSHDVYRKVGAFSNGEGIYDKLAE